MEAKKSTVYLLAGALARCLENLPDSEHSDGDHSWGYCWNALSDEAQASVKKARSAGQSFVNMSKKETR
jgi:hypothetical protein